MKNKVIIAVGVIVALVIGFVIGKIYGDKHHSFSTNDGINGMTVFENISDEVGYGIEFEAGQVPLNFAIYGGKLKVKITKENETVYEAELDKWQDAMVDIPETGYYQVTISGKNATGVMRYPVTENSSSSMNEVPDIVE